MNGATAERVVHQLLTPRRILLSGQAVDKWDAIRQLVDLVVESGDLPPEEQPRALTAVYEREQAASTGIGRGFAIPHGVYPGVPSEVGVLGIFQNGVDFDGEDGKPSHVVLMLLYPPQARNEHLQNVANAVRVLSSPCVEERLRRCRAPEEALSRLCDEDCESDT